MGVYETRARAARRVQAGDVVTWQFRRWEVLWVRPKYAGGELRQILARCAAEDSEETQVLDLLVNNWH